MSEASDIRDTESWDNATELANEFGANDGEAVIVWDNGSYNDDEMEYESGGTVSERVDVDEVTITVDFLNSVTDSDIYSVHEIRGLGPYSYHAESRTETDFPHDVGGLSLYIWYDQVVLLGEYVHVQLSEGVEESMVWIDKDAVDIEVGTVSRDDGRTRSEGGEVPRDQLPNVAVANGVDRLRQQFLE